MHIRFFLLKIDNKRKALRFNGAGSYDAVYSESLKGPNRSGGLCKNAVNLVFMVKLHRGFLYALLRVYRLAVKLNRIMSTRCPSNGFLFFYSTIV